MGVWKVKCNILITGGMKTPLIELSLFSRSLNTVNGVTCPWMNNAFFDNIVASFRVINATRSYPAFENLWYAELARLYDTLITIDPTIGYIIRYIYIIYDGLIRRLFHRKLIFHVYNFTSNACIKLIPIQSWYVDRDYRWINVD